ncbi:MAG: sensor histidine kinase [Pseudobdellovibrionaceae bacterium]
MSSKAQAPKSFFAHLFNDVNLSFYLRLAAVIFGCGIIAIAIALYTASSLSKQAEAQAAQKLFQGQLSSLAMSFESELLSARNQLIQVVREKEAKSSGKSTKDFTNVYAYTLNNSSFVARWGMNAAGIPNISAPVVNKALQDFLTEKAATKGIDFDFRVLDTANKVSRLAIITSVQLNTLKGSDKVAVIGFIEPAVFQEKIDKQRGYVDTLAFVDRTGRTVAHSQREYLGRSISLPTEVAISKNDKNEKIVSGALALTGLPGKVFASSKLEGAFSSSMQIFRTALLSIGILIVGLAAALVLLRKREDMLVFLNSPVALGEKVELPPLPSIARLQEPVVNTPINPSLPVQRPEPTPEISKTVVAQESKSRLSLATEISEGFVRELRPHLTAILGHSQLAKTKTSAEESFGHYISIESEARAAREALEKLTYFSQAENPHPKYRDEAVRLRELIDLALRPLTSAIAQQGLRIEKDLKSDYYVKGISAQLEQAFSEILRNAVEASRSGSRVEVSAVSTEKGVEVSVRDYGSGFDDKALKHSYEPFISTKSRENHKGLGLALAYGIIRSHQGEIKIESRMGAGSIVKIHLALAPKDHQSVFAREKTKAIEFRDDDSPLPEVLKAPSRQEIEAQSFIEEESNEEFSVASAKKTGETNRKAPSDISQSLKAKIQEDLKSAFLNNNDFDFIENGEEKTEEDFVVTAQIEKKKSRNKVDEFPFSVRKPSPRIEK